MQVVEFAKECKSFSYRFKQEGPGAAAVELDPGVALLAQYTEELARFQVERDSLTKAEVLFSLPITTFPQLDQIKSEMQLLQVVYNLYTEHQNAVKDWSNIPWATVDIQVRPVPRSWKQGRAFLRLNTHATYTLLASSSVGTTTV